MGMYGVDELAAESGCWRWFYPILESHVEYGWGKQHKATKLMGVPQQLGIRQFQVTRVVAKMSASIRHKILHLQAVIDWKSLHWKDRHPTTIADL